MERARPTTWESNATPSFRAWQPRKKHARRICQASGYVDRILFLINRLRKNNASDRRPFVESTTRLVTRGIFGSAKADFSAAAAMSGPAAVRYFATRRTAIARDPGEVGNAGWARRKVIPPFRQMDERDFHNEAPIAKSSFDAQHAGALKSQLRRIFVAPQWRHSPDIPAYRRERRPAPERSSAISKLRAESRRRSGLSPPCRPLRCGSPRYPKRRAHREALARARRPACDCRRRRPRCGRASPALRR